MKRFMDKCIFPLVGIRMFFILVTLGSSMLHADGGYPEDDTKALLGGRMEEIRQQLKVQGTDSLLPAYLNLSRMSDEKLFAYIEDLEQIAVLTKNFDSQIPHVDYRLALAGLESAARLQKRLPFHFFEAGDKAKTSGSVISYEANMWMKYLDSVSSKEKCSSLKLYLGTSIARLTLMKASLPEAELPSFPLTEPERRLKGYSEDRTRAFWELRLFMQVPMLVSRLKGVKCMDHTFEAHTFLQEGYKRYDFLQRGYNYRHDGVQTTIYRWPVGRAKQMCGRPFHTHYADMLQRDDLPFGVAGPFRASKTTEEFVNHLRKLDP